MKYSLILLLGAAFSVSAQESAQYIETMASGGSVNWTTGRVQAEGYGIAQEGARKQVKGLLACRAATADAQRNLLEVTQGVRVSAETTVSNYVAADDVVKTTVEGTIKGARIVSRDIQEDETCKVVLEYSMQGKMVSSIYRARQGEDENAFLNWFDMPFFAQAVATEQAPQAPWKLEYTELNNRLGKIEKRLALQPPELDLAKNTGAPSGMVIDARGSNFIPSMSPKLRKLRGNVLYPTAESQTESQKTGQLVSLFTRSVEFALNHPVVGDRPLLVKALRTYGDTRTEIVVGSDASTKITNLVEKAFFNEGGVIIVLD